jgi:hypothetical protein
MDRRSAFILLVVLVQGLLPLRYYLSNDRYDERFSWRMFSSYRMARCQVDYRDGDQPLVLEESFHSAWITLLKRGRSDVVEAVGRRACATHPGADLRLDMRCRLVDGSWQELHRDEAICP